MTNDSFNHPLRAPLCSRFHINEILIDIQFSVLLATLGEQCASTWRWIRSWALKLDGDDGSNAGDEESIKQPSIRISHSLPDLNHDPTPPQSNCPPEVREGKKVRITSIA